MTTLLAIGAHPDEETMSWAGRSPGPPNAA